MVYETVYETQYVVSDTSQHYFSTCFYPNSSYLRKVMRRSAVTRSSSLTPCAKW